MIYVVQQEDVKNDIAYYTKDTFTIIYIITNRVPKKLVDDFPAWH